MNPGDNHFRLNVIKTIEKYDMLSPHTSILVGFSGGADSVSLLHVLLSLKQKYQISVSAIHINHEIRGDEADRDELFCFDFCKKNGIKLFISRVNVPEYAAKNKMSLELAARELRYEEFAKILKNQKIDCVATAHTASDNAETVLLNLIRGYSIGGICGIPPKRDNIIRPLINLTRSEVIEYITLNNLNYIVYTDYLLKHIYKKGISMENVLFAFVLTLIEG
ncbi:MAG: tRNA lysidine(34) synthetase TilS, partial [Clostridia bacterium]